MLDSWTYDPLTPTSIDDIVGNHDVIQETAQLIRTNKASHLILVGPQGCGKSLFLRLVLKGFPILMIDCTANSGLRSVRDSIRNFARGSRTTGGHMRWIVFEHAETLTSDTQAFLRRMLETTSASTRIVFECQNAGAMSEPIVSRSSIVSFNSPDTMEIIFELQRRTKYSVPKECLETIVKYSYGNMRTALLNALVCLHSPELLTMANTPIIDSILAKRPKTNISIAWVQWAVTTESTCRDAGIDIRDVLRQGWPHNSIVANTCAQWSRLGGTSPRTLFFDCISSLVNLLPSGVGP
jgi:replication-associated recombination protein RarA